jgi:hypothetical protein
MHSKKLSALIALSMITASGAAMAQTAQPLSLQNSPAMASMEDANNLDDRNGIGIYIVGAVVLGLIVWGVLELTKDDDEGPSSP